jgi:hypothetical protein
MGEVQLRNAKHAMSENSFVQGLSSGDEAVLLTAASIQKRRIVFFGGISPAAMKQMRGYLTCLNAGETRVLCEALAFQRRRAVG